MSELILSHDTLSVPYIILEDFNIHVSADTTSAKSLHSILDIFSLNQHVNSLRNIEKNMPLNDYLCNFSDSLLVCLNKHAPLIIRVVTYRSNCNFIFTSELRSLKREKRKCERNHTRAVSRKLYNIVEYQEAAARATNKYFQRINEIRENSSIKEVSDANGDSRTLYNLCEK